jgi:sulfoxide reductase heme-binding subunit YedZ
MSVLAVAGPSAYWYLARGTGVVALLLLTASVVLGVMNSVRFSAGPRWPRFAIDTLHRDVSLLVLVVLAAHIITSVLDSFAPISLLNSVIPFTGSYRPLWIGLGALSFDLLVALVVTSLTRRRLGYRTWRAIHWFAYASWPVAVLHGLGTGTDTKLWWMLALTVLCVGVVLVAVWTRIGQADRAPDSIRTPAVVLSVAAPLGIAIFALQGPLQTGWANRAGTPAKLLRKSATPVAAVRVLPRPRQGARTLNPPFSAKLTGTVKQTQESGGAIVDLAMRLTGGAQGQLRIRMAGAPLNGGGLSMTGSQVDLAGPGLPSVMEGQIVSLQGQQFLARVASATGSEFDLRATLNINSQNGSVTGTLAASNAGSGP